MTREDMSRGQAEHGMKLALTTLIVRDYDEAIAFYCEALGFRLVEDSDLGEGKRWVVVGGDGGGALLLAKARKPEELAAVGNQFGGRVGLFAQTHDFAAVQARLIKAGQYSKNNRATNPMARSPCSAICTAIDGI